MAPSSWGLPTAVLVGAALALQAAGLAAGEHELVAHLRLKGREQLERCFWEISNPEHPEYLRHLSLEEVAGIVGSDDAEIESVRSWLLSLGARPSSLAVSPLRDAVSASFPAPRAEGGGHPALRALMRARPAAVDFVVRRDATTELGAAARDSARPSSDREQAGAGYSVSGIKQAYGMPVDLQANASAGTLQMVWGPGTFGYSAIQLRLHKYTECPLLDLSKVKFDTENHGSSGGDNYGEGNLDVKMIASFGLNVETLVSNTNASASTEEGAGFGQALLDFVTALASRQRLPHVLSISLGSLSAESCETLCSEAAKMGHSQEECQSYLQQQRQVCMFLSKAQVDRISTALQILGVRGVSVFGSSGDGGSHFSFSGFQGGAIAHTLNEISCKFQMPVFPTASPYIVSVGGTMWRDGDPSKPITWSGFGGGSGSGFSWQFPAPAYQRRAVGAYLSGTQGLPPAGSFNRSGRAYPDISAVAVQGTSQSSPLLAGIFSMLIDQRLSAGLPPLGFVAPRIWQVAQQFPGEAFEDVLEGNSKTSCDNGFPSAKGWDPNTGWGRPLWAGLVKHFASDGALGAAAPGQRTPRTEAAEILV